MTRRPADTALPLGDELFRQIAEHVGDVFWITDPSKQQVLYISPAYEQVWGRSVASLYDDPFSFLAAIHPDDRPRVRDALASQGSGTYHEEYRVQRPDGTLRWVRDRAFPVRDLRGEVYRIVGIATDITERRETVGRERLAYRELDARLRALIETANDAVLTIDEDSIILDWNSAAERMFGWTRDEAMGRVLTDLIVPPQHRGSHHAGLKRYLTSGVEGILNRRIETTALTRNGREFHVELAVWPVKSSERHTFSSFIRDISARKEAEAALKRSEEKYRQVVENANEGINVVQDGRVKFANARGFAIAGRTPEEAMAIPFIEMVHPDDRARVYTNYMRRIRGEQVENNYNIRVVSPVGEVRWIQVSAVVIEWEGKPATLNFLTDMTRQMELQEELKRALAKERELSELKTRFVAMASHEFRSPLATILSAVELLEDFGGKLAAGERGEVTGLIKGALKRMTEMIEQVLLVGRAQTQGLEFKPEALDARALCEQLVAEAGSARVRFVHSGEIQPRPIDEKLLRHALGNLLANALKYSRNGPVEFQLTATPEALEFRVRDQGIGIPTEDQARLFESFHRARNVGTVEGTGLGLAIVKQCVELHGGTVGFESELGRGSTFTVRIPAAA